MVSAVAIVGAGPAGLFAAERLAQAGFAVTLYDRMPSPARKFLMAGRGGLNLTHSEPLPAFLTRYSGSAAPLVRRSIEAFPPEALIAWAHGLGIETFTGSSGRIFPSAMKASPLLRAWLARLRELGVAFAPRWTWRGFGESPAALVFDTPHGPRTITPDAVLLALGGASWPKLGSDGAWMDILASNGVALAPLRPSNCGALIAWSPYAARFHGAPLKRIAIMCNGITQRGEAVLTARGLEGGAVYALSAPIRDALATHQTASISIDLKPDMPLDDLTARLSKAKAKDSLANVLRKTAGLSPAAIAVLRDAGLLTRDAGRLAARIKGVILELAGQPGMERAISSAGGVVSSSMNENFMLRARPGVFAAGEMLDTDAPTGGYLLQAAFSSAAAAAGGIAQFVTAEGVPSDASAA